MAQHSENQHEGNAHQRARREDAVRGIGVVLGLLISAVSALTGDLALGPMPLALASMAGGVLAMVVITAIGRWYVDRLHRQGR